ncbi:MAG: hypothetical protein ACON5F_11700 [Jejuia sp.]
MKSYENLKDKVDNAPDMDFGDIINNAIELFKKVWLKGFLTILILMVAGVVASLVFQAIGLAADVSILEQGISIESLSEFYSMSAIYSLPQNILMSSISILLVSAFYRICKNEVLGLNESDNYFFYFTKDYISKALMLGIIHALITAVAQALFLLPYIYAFVPLAYFTIVFANNPDLKEVDMVKLSFALGNKKWLISFGTMFVCGIIGVLGIIGCGIGLLFTISIAYLPVFFIYKEVIGFDNRNEIDLIGTNKDDDTF